MLLPPGRGFCYQGQPLPCASHGVQGVKDCSECSRVNNQRVSKNVRVSLQSSLPDSPQRIFEITKINISEP